jgi:predicted alpha-1,2-mannosidase
MFDTTTPIPNLISDVTGLIGMYAHGNEPCHHVAYLYNYAGQPWKTQARTRQVATVLYTNTPGGICGNDDCGQMSAWYVFTALGFYPVDPASGIYVLGSPLMDKVTLKLDPKFARGRAFTVIAKNNSATHPYIQSATLNGKAAHAELDFER